MEREGDMRYTGRERERDGKGRRPLVGGGREGEVEVGVGKEWGGGA